MGVLRSENQKGQPGQEGQLNDSVVTLWKNLEANGCDTNGAGSWHLGHEAGQYPSNRGFDRVLSLLDGDGSHCADMTGLMEAETPVQYGQDGALLEELPTGFYSSRSYAVFLIDAIRDGRHDGKPFLACLAFTSPQDPMHVPRPWFEYFLGDHDACCEVLQAQRIARAVEMELFPDDTQVPDMYEVVEPWDGLSLDHKMREVRGMAIDAGMVANMG